ncbi:MAG TPA: ferric reductase-like transmembrane domain-containing protein [Solirubrobacteraceae bacterium]
MTTALAQSHLFWILSRAAGTAALLFSSLAVGLGLTMALKLLRRKGPDLRVTHEALSIATMVAIVVHAVSLLGDRFLNPSVADIAIPFVSGYKEPWMSIGIVAGWAMIVLGLSYYVRRYIGSQRWRRLHRLTSLFWVAGLAHSIGEGTDAGLVWFVVCTGVVALPATFLLFYRWLPGPAPKPVAR